MRPVERVGDLFPELEYLGGGQRALHEPLGERLAFDHLHHQVVGVALAPDVVERADVRVVERGDRLRLALEARAHLGIGGEVLGQHLDRDVAAEAGVRGTEHLAHAARAERGGDLVRAEAGAGSEWHRVNLHQRTGKYHANLPRAGQRRRATPAGTRRRRTCEAGGLERGWGANAVILLGRESGAAPAAPYLLNVLSSWANQFEMTRTCRKNGPRAGGGSPTRRRLIPGRAMSGACHSVKGTADRGGRYRHLPLRCRFSGATENAT
jgi:hypothetical protein